MPGGIPKIAARTMLAGCWPFTSEDLNKPENRANRALLAACAVSSFRVRFYHKMGLPEDVALVPLQWDTKGRPDFTVVRGDVRIAGVESKPGRWKQGQENRYASGGLPIWWIVGQDAPPAGRPGITWQQIWDIASTARSEATHVQERATLEMLLATIQEMLGAKPYAPTRILKLPEDLPDDDYFREIAAPLTGGLFIGTAVAAENSVSLRLVARRALKEGTNRFGVGLAYRQARHPEILGLPTPEHLLSHLDARLHPWIAEWALVLRPAFDARMPRRKSTLLLNRTADLVPAATLAGAFAKLAELVRVL